jgi:hypothetical protein
VGRRPLRQKENDNARYDSDDECPEGRDGESVIGGGNPADCLGMERSCRIG